MWGSTSAVAASSTRRKRATWSRSRASPMAGTAPATTGREGTLVQRGVEKAEPAREIWLDRQLALELALQAKLLGVVALLLLAGGHERPERSALEPVDQIDGLLAAIEREERCQELPAETPGLELRADEIGSRDEILEIPVADHEPLVAEVVR